MADKNCTALGQVGRTRAGPPHGGLLKVSPSDLEIWSPLLHGLDFPADWSCFRQLYLAACPPRWVRIRHKVWIYRSFPLWTSQGPSGLGPGASKR